MNEPRLSRAVRLGLRCRVCWVESRESRRRIWWGVGTCPGCDDRHVLYAPASPPSSSRHPYHEGQPPALLIAWGEAVTDWITASQDYEQARAEVGFYPAAEAEAELETAIIARDAWLEICGTNQIFWIYDTDDTPEPWQLQEQAEHNARRSQARHPEQLWFHRPQFGPGFRD